MNRQISYKSMRVVVGVVAILLAPAVSLLAGPQYSLTSISISYWTDARDVFVGALVAVGFFLSAYNGSGGKIDLEFYLAKAASVFAICVALCPTLDFDHNERGPAWVTNLVSAVHLQPSHVHYGAAIALFVCLIAMMWFFSFRAMRKDKPLRAYLYRFISVAMASGIVLILLLGRIFDWPKTVLFVEVWALTFFGIGWLVAGCYKSDAVTGRQA